MRCAVLALLVGCGRLSFDAVTPPDAGESPIKVSVGPQRSTIGKTWLLHAARGTDTPCASDETWYEACDHPAEHMVVRVADTTTDCASLAFGDEIDAFDWQCSRNGDELVFESLGLKRDAGLRTLLDEQGWKPNRFVAKDGLGERFVSEPGIWWDNPVVPLPDNATTGVAVTLADSRTIYVLASSRPTAGYVIGADYIGVVILDGATLSWGGGASNCGRSQTVDSLCLVGTTASRTGSWIEGTFDGRGPASTAQWAVQFYDPYLLQLRGVDAHHCGQDGIALDYGVSLLHDVTATSNSASGIDGYATISITARHILTANNGIDGFSSTSFGMNLLADVRAFNNQNNGINFEFDATGMFTDVIAAHNGNTGVYCDNAYTGGAWHGITAVNNGFRGVDIRDLNGGTINRVLAANNGSDGIFIGTTQVSEVSQLVTVHNTGYGLAIDTMDDGLFINNLVVGNNAAGNCNVIGTGVNPGIDGACVSSATVTMGANLASTFLGGAATQSYGSITNWNLAQREQVYGRDAASTTSIGARGRCTTGTCRLWDYGLAPSDTVLRGVMYTPGQACPSEIAGGEELSGAQEQCFDMFGYPQVSCPRASLVNGMELLDDHVGNDDGFCESGERCEFLPHLSNARGRGPELAPCIFQDGTGADVVGVTIIGHTD